MLLLIDFQNFDTALFLHSKIDTCTILVNRPSKMVQQIKEISKINLTEKTMGKPWAWTLSVETSKRNQFGPIDTSFNCVLEIESNLAKEDWSDRHQTEPRGNYSPCLEKHPFGNKPSFYFVEFQIWNHDKVQSKKSGQTPT